MEERMATQAGADGAPRLTRAEAAHALGADRARLEDALTSRAHDAREAQDARTGSGLREDQAAAALAVLTDGRLMSMINAPAGSGKTRVLAEAARIWAARGGQVIGITPSQSARNTLAAGVPRSYNAAQFLGHLPGRRGARGPVRIGPGTLLIIDEASMLSGPDLADLIAFAKARGAKIILAGDIHQLQAVENGGGMSLLAEALGYARLAQPDLGRFRCRYRADGHGRAEFDPEMMMMMMALLLYGYCQGERSSRVIEKRCVRVVGYRVIAGGLCPDHATIARFRTRHEEALGGLFSQVLRLLAAEGMVSLGLLSLDETKLAGNAARKANRTLPQIEKILAEAAAADAAEDAREGATCSRRPRGYWPGGLNGGSGWPGPGTGSRWKTRRAGTHSGPSRRPGKRPRRPGSAADTARAMSRAPTGPAPSHGRTSPTRTCG
jgi:transposase